MNILYVIHNLGPEVPGSKSKTIAGGSEISSYTLAHTLSDQHTAYILYPNDKNPQEVHLHKISGFRNEAVKTYENLSQFHRLEAFRQILLGYEIDLIHYQHLIQADPAYTLIGKSLNIPQVLSLHDYYYICEEHFLENDRLVTCNVPANLGECVPCLGNKYKVDASVILRRRKLMESLLNQFDLIIAPSKSVRSDYIKVYPGISDLIKVVPIGVRGSICRDERDAGEELKVGIYSYLMTFVKGWDLIISVARILERYDDIKIVIKTEVLDENQINLLEGFTNIILDPNDTIPVHIVWLPTMARETFSLVASEALRRGQRLLCRKKGALATRFTEEHAVFYPEEADCFEVAEIIHGLVGKDTSLRLTDEEIESVAPGIDFYAKQVSHLYEKTAIRID